MILHVTLEKAEDDWIVAECPALPGCVSQGKDENEALENIKEAITAWLWAEDQKAISKKNIIPHVLNPYLIQCQLTIFIHLALLRKRLGGLVIMDFISTIPLLVQAVNISS